MPRSLVFSCVALAISALVHWPLARWALRTFPALAARRAWVWGITGVLVAAAPASRVAAGVLKGGKSQILAAVTMIELATVLFAMVPLLLVSGALRWMSQRRSAAEVAATTSVAPVAPVADVTGPGLSRRQVIEGATGIAMFGASASILGWGMVRGRHQFEVREVPVRIPGLPRALDGYTIAQISDIHVGVFIGERELDEGLSRVAEIKPDLVVATGDLVDHEESYIPLMARTLRSIRARDGVAAILGNHDYYTGANEVLAGLRAAGVGVLLNEGRVIRPHDGGGFALLGVADLHAKRAGHEAPSLERAIASVPRDLPRILLAHQPMYFEEAKGKVALQLSGHTHGGQINPGVRPAALFMRYLAGRYERQGSTLWVNSGFGVSGPPTRVGTPPEVTKIVLVAA